jgi:hypothetical protein
MLKCDFCGVESDEVKRVVLDLDYDRLSVKHEKMYACPPCSEKKDEERLEKAKAVEGS